MGSSSRTHPHRTHPHRTHLHRTTLTVLPHTVHTLHRTLTQRTSTRGPQEEQRCTKWKSTPRTTRLLLHTDKNTRPRTGRPTTTTTLAMRTWDPQSSVWFKASTRTRITDLLIQSRTHHPTSHPHTLPRTALLRTAHLLTAHPLTVLRLTNLTVPPRTLLLLINLTVLLLTHRTLHHRTSTNVKRTTVHLRTNHTAHPRTLLLRTNRTLHPHTAHQPTTSQSTRPRSGTQRRRTGRRDEQSCTEWCSTPQSASTTTTLSQRS